MKKIIYCLITICFLFLITGCKTIIIPKNEPYSIENKDYIGKYIRNYDTSFNDVTYKKMLEEAIENVKGATTIAEVEEAIIKAFNKTSELVQKYYVAQALYDYDNTNEEYATNKNILSDSYYEYEQFRANIIYEISDDEEILKYFFDGYTDDEIEFEVNLSKKKKEEKYVNLKKEIEEISDEYNKFNFDRSDKSNNAQVAEILYRFVNKNKELSDYLGFNSYVEYKDIEYYRAYTTVESDEFIKNVKKHIIPLLDSESTAIDLGSKINKLSYAEYNYLVEFDSTSFKDSDYKTINLAKDYAKKVGGSYYKTFTNFLRNENYILGGKENSLNSAYSNPYLSYFGYNNQCVTTLMHEFGHYNSFQNGYLSSKSLDLKEFYSQGNEFLFLSYLEQFTKLKKVYDVEVCNYIDTACLSMLIGSALREFEEKIYTNELTGVDDIINIWENLNTTDYNNLLEDYWKYEVRYDIYYISYATSVTGALSLYISSKTDFMKAVNSYITATNNMIFDDDLEQILVKNNLDSPFVEETFIKIKNLINEKRS